MEVNIAKNTVKQVDLKCVEWDNWKIKMTETNCDGMMHCAVQASDEKTKASAPTISPRNLPVDCEILTDIGEEPQYSKEKSTLNSPTPTTKELIQTASLPLTYSLSVLIPAPPSKILHSIDNRSQNHNQKTSKLDSNSNCEKESYARFQHILPWYENISSTSSAESSPNKIETTKTKVILGENIDCLPLEGTDLDQHMLDTESTYLVENSNADLNVLSHSGLDYNSVPNFITNTNLGFKTKPPFIDGVTESNNTFIPSSKTSYFETDANETCKDAALTVDSIPQMLATAKTIKQIFETAEDNNMKPLVRTDSSREPNVKPDLNKKNCPKPIIISNRLPIIVKKHQLKNNINSVLDLKMSKLPLESSTKYYIDKNLRQNDIKEQETNLKSNSKSISESTRITDQHPNTNRSLKTISKANEYLNLENSEEISDLNNNLNLPYEKTNLKINSVPLTRTNSRTNLKSSTKGNIETNPRQKDNEEPQTNLKSNSKSISVSQLHVDSVPEQNTCTNKESNIRKNSEPNVNPDETGMLGQNVELLRTDNDQESNNAAQIPDLFSMRPRKRIKHQRSRVSPSNIITSEGDDRMLRLRCVGCGGTGELQCLPGRKSLYCVKRCYPKFSRVLADSFTAGNAFYKNKDKCPSKRAKKCCRQEKTRAKRMCLDIENLECTNKSVPARSLSEFGVAPRRRQKSNVIRPLESNDNGNAEDTERSQDEPVGMEASDELRGSPSNQTISARRSPKEADSSIYKRQEAAVFGRLKSGYNYAQRMNNAPSVMMQRKPPIKNTINDCHEMQGTSALSMMQENSRAAVQTNMLVHSKNIRQWNEGQAYVALSRVKSLEGLCIEESDCNKLLGNKPCNNEALNELNRMRSIK